MTTRGVINSNFYQIVNVDANGAPTEVKPEYIGNVGNANYANYAGNAVFADSANIANSVAPGTQFNLLYKGANANGGLVEGIANIGYDPTTNSLNSYADISIVGGTPANFFADSGHYFVGDGGYLSNITATSTNANYSNFAGNAFSVDVANVVGIGNIATVNLDGNAGNILYGNGVFSAVPDVGNANSANYANYANYAGNAYSVDVANVVGIGNIATLNIDGNAGNILYGNGVFSSLPDVGNANSANYANYANFAGVAYSVSGSNVSGDVAGANHANIADVANSVAGANVSGSVAQSNYANIANSVAGANVSGSVAQSNYANIANSVAGANVSGYVANATHATVADSANAVAGANVSGYVANATHATVADSANAVAGANVSGSVAQSNYANIANSVAGANVSGYVANATHATVADSANAVAGANVSGSVAQANYANIANSVAVANVVGIGNIATINLNSSSTQVLFGNGVFATISIPSGSGISNGTSNVNIPVANGNVNTSVGAVANVFVVTTTGANVVGNLDVTANIAGNSLQLKTGTGVTTANVGAMFWDATEQTVTLGMNNSVQQQIGLENYILVKAGSAITDGQVVMYSGSSSGNNVIGVPADVAAAGFRPSWILGIATQNIALNGTGYITTFGHVHGLNTNAYNEGDLLFLSTSTPGAFTATEPTAPNWHIEVGTVVKKSGSGVVQVAIRVNDKVANLSDVTITTPSAGQALIYTSSNTWVNGNPNIANIAYSVAGANVSGQVGNALVAGTVYTNAQPNITSTGTLTGLNVSSAINATSFTSNVATGTAPFTVTSTTQVANLNVAQANLANTANAVAGANVSGSVAQANYANIANSVAGANVSGTVANATYATSAGSATTAGTVTTAAQPNITSVGSLTGLTVSNATGVVDFTTTANVTLGSVSNLHISGGTANYVLKTDGLGNLSWTAGATVPGGANTYVQTNDSGSFGGFAGFTFNKTSNLLTATNIAGNGSGLTSLTGANVTGTVANATYATTAGTATSATTAGTVTTADQPNITSTGTLTYLGVTATVASQGAAASIQAGSASNANLGILSVVAPSTVALGNIANLFQIYTNNTTSNTNALFARFHVNGVNKFSVDLAGNVTAGYYLGNGSQLTGITATATPGGLNTYVQFNDASTLGGVAGFTFNKTTNLLTATNIAGNGSGLTSLTGANVTGTVPLATSATTAGTVTTAAQPNITSTGSLTGLTVSNATGVVNFTTTANVTLGAIGNLHISGGSSGQYITTDGSGGLSFTTGSGGVPAAIANGTSNINIAASGGVANVVIAGVNTVTFNSTSSNFASNIGMTANTIVSSNSEISIGETGDTYGPIYLRLQNRVGLNGALFDGSLGSQGAVVDFAFKVSGPIQKNIRFEARGATPQFEFGAPGAPTFISSTTQISSNVTTVSTSTTTGSIVGNGGLGIAGNAYIGGNANIAGIANVTGAGVFGANVTAPYFIGNGSALTGLTTGGISNGTSNISAPILNGNITVSIGAVANTVVFTSTGTNVTGYLTSSANITAPYFIGNGSALTGIAAGAGGSTTQLQYNNAGVLAGMANVTFAAGNLTLGPVANVKMTGGTNGYFLQTDGTGNLSWVTGGGSGSGVVGGANTQVQFNDAGNFGGSGNLTFDKTTNSLATTNFTAANVSTVKYNETVIAGGSTGAATITPNAAAGTIYNYTLTGNITLSALTNAVAGTGMTIILTQDATGNRTLTSTMKFLGGVKTLSTAAAAIDIMSVFYDGTTYYASLGKGFA